MANDRGECSYVRPRKKCALGKKHNYKYSKHARLKTGDIGWKRVKKNDTQLANTLSQGSSRHSRGNIGTKIIVRQTILVTTKWS